MLTNTLTHTSTTISLVHTMRGRGIPIHGIALARRYMYFSGNSRCVQLENV